VVPSLGGRWVPAAHLKLPPRARHPQAIPEAVCWGTRCVVLLPGPPFPPPRGIAPGAGRYGGVPNHHRRSRNVDRAVSNFPPRDFRSFLPVIFGIPMRNPPQPERDHLLPKKKTTTQRGYGYMHQSQRRRWGPKVAAGGVSCARCGNPILPGEPWDLGHVDCDPTRYAGPEHAGCNRAVVTHLKQQLQQQAAPRRNYWSRHWYPGSGFDERCPDCRALGSVCSVGNREAGERR
jgi:hypothetical protein